FGVPANAPLTAPLTNFGTVTIGQSAAANIILTASKAVTIQSISTSNSQFQVGTVTLPASLTNSQTLSVPVTFQPTVDTLVSGALQVVTNLGTLNFSLAGAGQDAGAHLAAYPSVLSLGGTTVGGTLIGTLTFSNT